MGGGSNAAGAYYHFLDDESVNLIAVEAAGLIAPTNGDNWAKTVSKGRADPFATLALQPIEVTEKNPLAGTGTPIRSATAKLPGNVIKTAANNACSDWGS